MRKKKLMALAMTTIMTLSLGVPGAASAEAATKTSKSKKWAAAYMKIIKKMNKEDKAREENPYFENQAYKYDLIYFDNDSIPELVVGLDGYWVSMYTYDKKTKKVYEVIDKWGYGAGGNHGYMYLPKKNVLYNLNSDFAGALYYEYYGKMKNHKIVDRYPKSLSQQYFNDANENGFPDDGEYIEEPIYFYGDKKISKKKYNSYGFSGEYKTICGSIAYKQMKKKLNKKM